MNNLSKLYATTALREFTLLINPVAIAGQVFPAGGLYSQSEIVMLTLLRDRVKSYLRL